MRTDIATIGSLTVPYGIMVTGRPTVRAWKRPVCTIGDIGLIFNYIPSMVVTSSMTVNAEKRRVARVTSLLIRLIPAMIVTGVPTVKVGL